MWLLAVVDVSDGYLYDKSVFFLFNSGHHIGLRDTARWLKQLVQTIEKTRMIHSIENQPSNLFALFFVL